MGSQRYTQQDLMNFDWDDSPLIAAYDKAKARVERKRKQAKNESAKKHSSCDDKDWRVGDYCRALYAEDGYYYEAKILELDGEGKCTVEFIGYDDPEEVDVENLKRSKGKKARKSQIQSIVEETESMMSLTCGESSDGGSSASSAARERRHRTRVAENVDFCPLGDGTPSKHNRPMPYGFPLPPYLPPPPMPMMPQCPSHNNDPTIHSMLRSWFMAGYYFGLYEQTQNRTSYSAPCCCGHANQCCQY